MVYIKGEYNIADYLSRHPSSIDESRSLAEEYINFIANESKPSAISMNQLQDESKKDGLL